jgi:hypothetical protein
MAHKAKSLISSALGRKIALKLSLVFGTIILFLATLGSLFVESFRFCSGNYSLAFFAAILSCGIAGLNILFLLREVRRREVTKGSSRAILWILWLALGIVLFVMALTALRYTLSAELYIKSNCRILRY